LKPNQQGIGARHIVKTFGKGEAAFTALNDVSVEIGAGESVAIVGKSGSGKSTLMHILALLDKPSAGTLLVGNQDTSRLKGRQIYELRNQHFGFVFQQFFLNERDSVLGNVTLPLVIAGVGRKEREERGLAALRAVELADKAHTKASNLSGGQKQRVCVARALINRPSVIFADEPTGNLDSHTGKTVEDLMFRLNHKERITLIIVTHDPDIAARCTRQIHIKDGHLTHGGAV
jgi:putative ABC transport system ATP-binding protein